MAKDVTIKLSKEMENYLEKKASKQNQTLEKIVEKLIKEQINSRIIFEEGFYYDNKKKTLYQKSGEIVELTKLQAGLLNLLLEKKDEIVDFNTIHKEVWKNKNMSIYTMRNIIKRIRDLTYYGIIVNHSNKGYSIGKTF
jgi:DNA-binding winged helix-turn-helix (wHTH) protein